MMVQMLRHLPNVHSLYIYAPSAESLAPLINEPHLLPKLEKLWLGRNNAYKGDVDYMSVSDCSSEGQYDFRDYDSEDGVELDGDEADGDGELARDAVPQDNIPDIDNLPADVAALWEESGDSAVNDDPNRVEDTKDNDAPDDTVPVENDDAPPRPKTRRHKIKAKLLLDLFKKRPNLEIQLTNNMEVVGEEGDLKEIDAIFSPWDE